MTKAKDVPEMHEALSILQPYLSSLYEGFEVATTQAKNNIEDQGLTFELGLHASLTRSYFSKFFEENVQKTIWKLEKLNNNGLQLSIKEWLIRARKEAFGTVPKPKTKRYEAYLKQQPTLGGEFDRFFNLMLLWKTDHKGILSSVSLVYPLSESTSKWRYNIPHPLNFEKSNTDSERSRTHRPEKIEELPLVFSPQFQFNDLGELELEYIGDNNELELEEEITETIDEIAE